MAQEPMPEARMSQARCLMHTSTASSAARRWRCSCRLILLSILVGVLLAALGLDPLNILDSVRSLVMHVWDMGFDAVRWLWQYFLLGAVIVVPLWFLVRLVKAPKGG